MIPPNRLVVAMLILMGLVLVLVGCEIGLGGANSITCDSDFSRLLPPDWKIVSQSKLENGNPTELCCVVFYRTDVPKNGWSKPPIGGVVIRVDHDRPKDIHTYPLTLPDGLYLGENQLFVRTEDVLSGLEENVPPVTLTKEFVVEDKIGDLVIEASIFSEQDIQTSEDNPYKSHGWFIGDGGITVERDRVTVRVRQRTTRSQLADRFVYTPRDNKTYYQVNTTKLIPPAVTDWTSLSMPEDPAASEYPEKVVLAFYERVADSNKLQGLMIPEAFKAFVERDPVFGCLADRTGALVKGIDYTQASSVPSHTENDNRVITGTVIVMSTCVINGRPSDKEMKLAWPVQWEKDKDKWELLKPTVKP